MTGLSASGVWLTWRRLKSSAISKTQFATMPVIGIGLLIAYFAWYPNYKNTLDEVPKLERALQPLVDGNISIEGYLGIGNGDDTAKPDGSVRLVISADNGWPNLQQITLSLDTGESNESNEITIKSIFYNTNTVIKPKFDKALLAKAKSLTAKVSLHSGRHLIFNWPLNM